MSSKFEVRYIPMDVAEFRMDSSEDGKTVKLVGHAAVANSFSNDLGGFKEIIRPGAFAGTLKNNPDVRFLVNHSGMPLARTKSKTLQLSEDQRGLAFTANLNSDDPDVKALLPKIQRGDVDSMSFGFRCLQDNWRTENGQDIRELHAVDLHNGDISAVCTPAYDAANVSMRSLDEVRQSHKEYRRKIDAEVEVIAVTRGMSIAHARRLLAL
jgi:HK97 family phage prohead protease